jgi:hypothetical protein
MKAVRRQFSGSISEQWTSSERAINQSSQTIEVGIDEIPPPIPDQIRQNHPGLTLKKAG